MTNEDLLKRVAELEAENSKLKVHSPRNYVHKNMFDQLSEKLTSQAQTIEKLKEGLNKIAEYETCEVLNPGQRKYKSYEDGWFGVATFARQILKEIGE